MMRLSPIYVLANNICLLSYIHPPINKRLLINEGVKQSFALYLGLLDNEYLITNQYYWLITWISTWQKYWYLFKAAFAYLERNRTDRHEIYCAS